MKNNKYSTKFHEKLFEVLKIGINGEKIEQRKISSYWGELLGMGTRTIYDSWKIGGSYPRLEEFTKICRLKNISSDELLSEIKLQFPEDVKTSRVVIDKNDDPTNNNIKNDLDLYQQLAEERRELAEERKERIDLLKEENQKLKCRLEQVKQKIINPVKRKGDLDYSFIDRRNACWANVFPELQNQRLDEFE